LENFEMQELTGMETIKVHLAAAMCGAALPSFRDGGTSDVLAAIRLLATAGPNKQPVRDDLAQIGLAALGLLIGRMEESMRAERELALLLDQAGRQS
jgi:hypothetical protein